MATCHLSPRGRHRGLEAKMQQDCHEIGMQHKIKTAMVCKHLATAKALFGVACRFVIFCGVAIQKVFLFF